MRCFFIVLVGALALGVVAWGVRGGERQGLLVRRPKDTRDRIEFDERLSPEVPFMESAAEAESPARPDVPRPRESSSEPFPGYRESGWWELDVQGKLFRVDVVPNLLDPAVILER